MCNGEDCTITQQMSQLLRYIVCSLHSLCPPCSIVNNMIWSMQVEIPDSGNPRHPSRTCHGSLRCNESYSTMVVSDAMAALKARKTPSPNPILEEEDDECSPSHHIPKVIS